MRILFSIILAICSLTVAAQNQTDYEKERLAFAYYNSHEFDKAAAVFEELFSKTGSKNHFNYLINCLVEEGYFDAAEKLTKKQISKSSKDPELIVKLGYIYKQNSETEKAEEQFQRALKELSSKQNINDACNAFLRAGEYAYAEKTLIKGKEIIGYDFKYELVSVYAADRNYPKMIDTQLDILDENPSSITNIQNMMQYYINNDVNNEYSDILRTVLLQRIQKNPSIVASEMLIWFMTQKKQFAAALIQVRALDKRLNENGAGLINIGDAALESKDYETAVKAYTYAVEKGEDSPVYQRGRFGLIRADYKRITQNGIQDPEQIADLELRYVKLFEDFGLSASTISDLFDLAHLQTYKLGHPEKAEIILNNALQINGLPIQKKAEIQLELGDIALYKGDQWQALLLYARVENDFKNSETGDEACFRKARVAYFTGNFKWATSQLDVLKQSTSKLIANDAMQLSVLISDNADKDYNEDSVSISDSEDFNKQLKIYARADMLFAQQKYNEALTTLDSIIEIYPSHSLVDEAILRKAEIFSVQQQYQQAADCYEKIISNFASGILADKACFFCGDIYLEKLNRIDRAKELYMKILEDYPGSIFAVRAREKYQKN